MKVRTLTIALGLALTQLPLQAGLWTNIKSAVGIKEKPQPPAIKVLLATGLDGATLEVKGRYNIYDPYKDSRLATRFATKSEYIEALDTGIKWGEEFPGVYQVVFAPDKPETTIVVNGIEYRGKIYAYNVGGKISLVNEVDIEDFITSLMSTGVTGPVPHEVLAAVAITARTDAYYRAGKAQDHYWHVQAGEVGYYGYGVTDFRKGIERAVNETKQLVMSTYGQGLQNVQPFPASWGDTGLTIAKAEEYSRKGDDAGRLIMRFFPDARIAQANGLQTASKESDYVVQEQEEKPSRKG